MPRVKGGSPGRPMSRAGSRSRHEPGPYSASISTPLMVLKRVRRSGARCRASASVRSRQRRSRSPQASVMAAALSSPRFPPPRPPMPAPAPATGGGSAPAAPTPPPDPAAPCAGADEQRAPGFYPDLEALLPTKVAGAAPATRDSGRYCSAETLGSLLEAGIAELRFAGATWPGEGETGIALVVYRATGLTADAVADSFAVGAGAARGVTQVHASERDVAGRRGIAITAVSGRRPQTVIIWPATAAETVNVVIGSGEGEDRLEAAVSAFGDR